MRRLYLQIYATVVGILIVFALLVGGIWRAFGPDYDDRRMHEAVAIVLGRALPPTGAPDPELDALLASLAESMHVSITLRDADGRELARAGDELPAPSARDLERGYVRGRGTRAFALRLPDGRTFVAASQHRSFGWLFGVAALGVAIALGAYPVVRRITHRLEHLRAQVEALGAGDLGARVDVRGKDEIAALAGSFNRAAERIAALVGAQRNALAAASHELRSPLARIRMAIELLGGGEGAELRARVSRDIAELDALIGELLLASRLDALPAGQALDRREPVDLLGLAAEEAARVGGDVSGDAVTVAGDPSLLRRLVRNLLENARRYAAGAAVELRVERRAGGGARLLVADRGPGVAEAERERIFEPFYRPAGASESANGSFGVGLALVRQIARHHGGDARCRARDGGGTIFEVELKGAP